MTKLDAILEILSKTKYPLNTEGELQKQIAESMIRHGIPFLREKVLDAKNRIDFFFDNDIGAEVKIKGNPMSIYKQCERYCKLDQIQTLILVTNKAMGFPAQIQGKDCFVVNLGKAWL